MIDKEYLTVSEAAAKLNLSKATIRRNYNDRVLDGYRAGNAQNSRIRISSDSIRKMIEHK